MQTVVPTLEATQALTTVTTPVKTVTATPGVTQVPAKTTNSFSVEPLPESTRPRKDGPGGN